MSIASFMIPFSEEWELDNPHLVGAIMSLLEKEKEVFIVARHNAGPFVSGVEYKIHMLNPEDACVHDENDGHIPLKSHMLRELFTVRQSDIKLLQDTINANSVANHQATMKLLKENLGFEVSSGDMAMWKNGLMKPRMFYYWETVSVIDVYKSPITGDWMAKVAYIRPAGLIIEHVEAFRLQCVDIEKSSGTTI